nr:hypothetical protein [bacterium]
MPRNDTWQVLGPGGGGAQFIPTISPHNPDVILAACDMTGSYITKDGGKSWRLFNLRSRTDAFAFDPCDENRMYAGGQALWRSDDGGDIWEVIFPRADKIVEERKIGDHSGSDFVSLDNFPGGGIHFICVDPQLSDCVYVAISNARGTLLYATFDDGQSFSELCCVPGKKAHCIWIDPQSDPECREGVLITDGGVFLFDDSGDMQQIPLPEGAGEITDGACGLDADGEAMLYVLVPGRYGRGVSCSGVLRGNLDGQWVDIAPAPDGGADITPGHFPDFRLVQTLPGDARYAYVAVFKYPESRDNFAEGSVDTYHGILKTQDYGNTWQWVLRSNGEIEAANRDRGWCDQPVRRPFGWHWLFHTLTLSVSPVDPDHVMATDFGTTIQSRDGGRSWKQNYTTMNEDGTASSNGMDVTTCYGVHFDPFNKDHIAISYTDIGLFHSWDGGKSWIHPMEGIGRYRNTCYWLEFDPDIKDKIWSVWSSAHDLPRPKMYRSGRHNRAFGGLCLSEDGMKTWHEVMDGIPEHMPMTHIILDPNSPAGNRTLYVAGYAGEEGGVYKSTDDGRTWQQKCNGIDGNRNVFRLALAPDGALYVVVARGWRHGKDVPGAVYVSRDGAESFEKLCLPPEITGPNDITIDPTDGRLYLCCWPQTVQGREYGGGVYVSDDGGQSWEQTYNPHAHAYALAIDPTDNKVLYVCGFDHALDRSDDRGQTWQRVRGYNFHWGQRPVVDIHDPSKVYVATFGGSLWYGPGEGDPMAAEDMPAYAFLRGSCDLE